jgi:hypothetical protein
MTLTPDQRARIDDPVGRAILACLAEAHRAYDAAWLDGHIAWLDNRDRAGHFAGSAEAEAASQWLLFALSAHVRGEPPVSRLEPVTDAQRRAKTGLVAALERLVPRSMTGVSPMAAEMWQCEGCHEMRPWHDGAADDDPELCDSCWGRKHGIAESGAP